MHQKANTLLTWAKHFA